MGHEMQPTYLVTYTDGRTMRIDSKGRSKGLWRAIWRAMRAGIVSKFERINHA